MDTTATRDYYPSDISDEQWDFAAPYLTLIKDDAPQRDHDLREVFNGLRLILRTGSPWRYLPRDLPPYYPIYQQTQRWIRAGCLGAIVHDLRALIRLDEGQSVEPTAAIFDSRTLLGTPESGDRTGYDGHKKKMGSNIHRAVDTLGEFLALVVTLADENGREDPRSQDAGHHDASMRTPWMTCSVTPRASSTGCTARCRLIVPTG